MHEAELQVSTVAMQFPSSEVSPLPISSISHLSRVVKEVEKTSAFYANVLGFVPVRRPSSFEFEGSWVSTNCSLLGVPRVLGKPTKSEWACTLNYDPYQYLWNEKGQSRSL